MQSSHFWTLKIKSEEFEFAFELHELEPSKFDNARLLHRLICIQRATSLHNRARIWGLARCLKGILDLSEPDTTTMVNNPSDPVGLDWGKLHWSIKPPNSGQEYAKGCQILYTQRVILTGHLRQITVSSINMEDTVHITGLKLSFDDGTNTQLGYRSQDNSSTDVVAFGGFVVAGFKLVSLALGRPLRPKRKSRRSLLDTALWYPSIPPENLRIADGFSVGQSPTTSRHSLLFWVWLGGPGGSYLQYLTGISGTRFKGGLGGIEFHFSTDSVPITSGSWVFVMTRKGRISPLMELVNLLSKNMNSPAQRRYSQPKMLAGGIFVKVLIVAPIPIRLGARLTKDTFFS
ncbi:hypothetical protein EMGR_007769 [Emarellia grisea]